MIILNKFGCLSIIHPSILFIPLLLLLLLLNIASASLQILPHFTGLPPPISQFVYPSSDGASFPPVELVCRAWPANSKLHILAQQVTTSPGFVDHQTFGANPIVSTSLIASNPNNNNNRLIQLPHGLGSQRHAILPASQITSNHANSDASSSGHQSVNPLIIHETSADAIRDNPAAGSHDEVAIRLIVSSQPELSQMELMRLHCLVATSFGRKLSAPFRMLPASLGSFPSPRSGGTSSSHTENVEFLRGNIAIVDCYLPINSFPKPLIEFELNNTVIDLTASQSEKYRQITRPDGKRVSLLIQNFQPRDCGIYRCVAINPLTREKKYSPDAVNLKIIIPDVPVAGKIRVPMASESIDPRNAAASQEIVVREGQNVTLFCIIQSAPPPIVTTYPFEQNSTAHNRFHRHNLFGLLEITNVHPSDAGIYICTNRQLSSTAQLRVRKRLRLTTKPQDALVSHFGESIQFKCTSSIEQVIPYWLFNGQPKITGIGKNNTLTITNVTSHDIGVYQCIAHRWDPDPDLEEWVSASAVLAMKSDKIIRTPQELALLLPTSKQTIMEAKQPEIVTDSLTPIAEPVYDNLAVYITWKAYTKSETHNGDDAGVETNAVGQIAYRVEYSMQISPAERQYISANSNNNMPVDNNNNNSTDLDNTNKPSDISDLPALIGLIGHEAILWSDPTALNQQFSSAYAYATGEPLQPGRRYRFRVIALDPSTGLHLVPPSGWSNIVSMEHISQVEPPQIKVVRPMSEGRVHVVWMFNGVGGSSSNINDLSILSKSSSSSNNNNDNNIGSQKDKSFENPSLLDPSSSSSTSLLFLKDSNNEQFIAEHFLILARPVIKPKRGSGGSIEYGAYWATQVNGSNARDGLLTGLNNTANYQIIVYGVKGTGDNRQITRFSKAVYVNMASTDYTGRYSLLDTLNNNRLLYIILGGIAGLMFLVMFILILLCLCRQHQDRRLHNQRKKQNGYVHGYKDSPDFHAIDGASSGLNNPQLSHNMIPTNLNNNNNNMNSNNNPNVGNVTLTNTNINNNPVNTAVPHSSTTHDQGMSGTIMMMGNLQCNGLSDHSASNNPVRNESQHHQMYMQQQQQQPDQYSSSLGMSKEMFQQRQAMLGSQLQLQQHHSQSYHQPPHHQSHHSLLLPSVGSGGGGNSNHQMLSGHNNNMLPPTMFHSGTLPGGPRYLRQQQLCGSHYFGSQQPLDRNMVSPTNAMEMTELYHHQQQQNGGYAYQQPQLPPIPHPQSSSGLPPLYPAPSNNGTINRQMMFNQQQGYYSASLTPGGGGGGSTSLKREPPTGGGGGNGSLQDGGSGYGTLLQRGGPLTASMMTDPSIGGGVPMNAVYYRGSQQALHIYPNGMSTPQSQQYQSGLYQSHQQQQQQQQALYMQQQMQQAQMYPGYFSPQPHMDSMGHMHHNFNHTDGESVYSYFSQQDMNQPGAHQHLNPLPEENQLNQSESGPGYVDSGIQTAEMNGTCVGTSAVGTATDGGGGSPAAGGSHRHHRRRKRKQSQQQSQSSSQQPTDMMSDPSRNVGVVDDANNGMEHVQNQGQSLRDSQLDLGVQKRQHTLSPGPYSDTDPMMITGQSNIMANLHSYPHGAVSGSMEPSSMSRYIRYDSPQQAPSVLGQLPPPNQPPPPPPPPAVAAMAFASNMTNNIPDHSRHNSMIYQQHHHFNPDSLSRHLNRNISAAGSGGGSSSGGIYHPSNSSTTTGLLVGPPPRIRDYSEYGIPRGIGLPPTPTGGGGGGQPQPPQHNVLMTSGGGGNHNTNGGMYYDGGRYREGQA
ncbi:Basement membrane-specific heparan sulfate proteoglycan core protein [Schistosoma japonicum]|nr:Basement membrane-specific heparan sulfate proteoglycan core protein [Schistosoma japonicum]